MNMSFNSCLVQLIDSFAHESSRSENADGVHIKTFDDPHILMRERMMYSGLGPHPRILECLNPFDWTVPLEQRVSATEPLRFPKAPHGDLQQYLLVHPDPPLPLRIQWIRQIAEGLEFIHSRDIFWADCTPANMLLMDDLAIVLCDFEGSVTIRERTRVVLPDRYMQPDADFSGDYFRGPKVDIYAFGCVMLEILTHGVANVENRGWIPDFHRGGLSSDPQHLLIDLLPFSPFKTLGVILGHNYVRIR
ncbi:kinase-like domain-containing protein [Favolaschia claudopus]|uniref:Kinase-like domain-containing protein n=1 Tax=Favolaschia claudopus TaxID=2862362 RepID=A0AAW0AEC5_9AGAR